MERSRRNGCYSEGNVRRNEQENSKRGRHAGERHEPSVTSESSLARVNAPLVATVTAGAVVVATGLAMVLRKGTAAARA